MVLTFYVGSSFGITGVALGWLLVHPIMRLPVYLWIFRGTGMTAGEYLSVLRPSLCATALMVAGVLGLSMTMPQAWSTTVRLVAQVGAGIAVYGVVSLVQRRRLQSLYADFRALGRALTPRDRSATPGAR
jgi:hypothetical protein